MTKAQIISRLLQIADEVEDCGERGGKDIAIELKEIAHTLADEVK